MASNSGANAIAKGDVVYIDTSTSNELQYRPAYVKAASGAGEYRLFVVQIQFNGNPVMAVNEVETNTLAMTIQKGAYFYKKTDIDTLLAA